MENLQIPQKGFYTHYKHTDLKNDPFNYTYEVVGLGRNTEDDTYCVLYRPLYVDDHFNPADFWSRPLDMFIEDVEKKGIQVPRFTLITDSEVIDVLKVKRKELYGV